MATTNGWTTGFGSISPWNDDLIGTSNSSSADSMANNPLTTSSTSSAARMLGQYTPAQPAQQSSGTLAQTLTGGNSTTAGNAGYSATYNAMVPTQSKLATDAANQVVANVPTTAVATTTPTYTVSNQTAHVAPNAQGTPAVANYGAFGNWTNSYAGPQIVGVRTTGGQTAYYQFNSATGQYTYVQTYDKNGNIYAGQTGGGSFGFAIPAGTTMNADGTWSTPSLSADQRGQAASTSLGANQQIQAGAEGSAASLAAINQAYATNETAYKNAYGDQQRANDAATAANQAAAQANAAALAANPFAISGGLAAPDTSAVDANGRAALNSLISQYQTGNVGADAAAQQAAAGTTGLYQAGQNLLAHNSDYASKFNTNLSAFKDALSAQSTADTNTTGQKLQQDIQSVKDALNTLTQQAGQLDTSSQQAVQAQVQQLQQQIQTYQAAAAQYGANSANAKQAAAAVLSGGGSLVAAAV